MTRNRPTSCSISMWPHLTWQSNLNHTGPIEIFEVNLSMLIRTWFRILRVFYSYYLLMPPVFVFFLLIKWLLLSGNHQWRFFSAAPCRGGSSRGGLGWSRSPRTAQQGSVRPVTSQLRSRAGRGSHCNRSCWGTCTSHCINIPHVRLLMLQSVSCIANYNLKINILPLLMSLSY